MNSKCPSRSSLTQDGSVVSTSGNTTTDLSTSEATLDTDTTSGTRPSEVPNTGECISDDTSYGNDSDGEDQTLGEANLQYDEGKRRRPVSVREHSKRQRDKRKASVASMEKRALLLSQHSQMRLEKVSKRTTLPMFIVLIITLNTIISEHCGIRGFRRKEEVI